VLIVYKVFGGGGNLLAIFSPVRHMVPMMDRESPVITENMSAMNSPTMKMVTPPYSVRIIHFGIVWSIFILVYSVLKVYKGFGVPNIESCGTVDSIR